MEKEQKKTRFDEMKEKINKMTPKEFALFMTVSSYHIQGFKNKEIQAAVDKLEELGFIDDFVKCLEMEVPKDADKK